MLDKRCISYFTRAHPYEIVWIVVQDRHGVPEQQGVFSSRAAAERACRDRVQPWWIMPAVLNKTLPEALVDWPAYTWCPMPQEAGFAYCKLIELYRTNWLSALGLRRALEAGDALWEKVLIQLSEGAIKHYSVCDPGRRLELVLVLTRAKSKGESCLR